MIRDRVERFWSNVDKRGPDQCWEWKRYTDKDGYGRFRWGSPAENRGTHRIAWELSTSADAGKLCVCHRCDNPRCCNPHHLFIGTQIENNLDRTAKGRGARGEQSNQSDLCEEDVIDIRSRCVRGSRVVGYGALGREYGVCRDTIFSIVNRVTWTHL